MLYRMSSRQAPKLHGETLSLKKKKPEQKEYITNNSYFSINKNVNYITVQKSSEANSFHQQNHSKADHDFCFMFFFKQVDGLAILCGYFALGVRD